MEFEHNTEEVKREDAQVDLNGGLVDAHFSLEDLFVSAGPGDYASSISSASPPHEWPQPLIWNGIRQAHAGEIDSTLFNPSMANGAHPSFDENMFDFPGLSGMNGMNNMIIGMPSNIFINDMPITLPPSELHKSPQDYQFIPPAMMSMAQNNNSPQAQDNDIAATVKRLTGITNAQIAGAPSAFAHADYGIPPGFSDNSYSSASSDRSSVPPQTMEPNQPSSPTSEAPAEGALATSTARPKTAHTTIERRYRTNLNTCIVGLRNSIPAVRYLDKSYRHPSGVPDKPDERGFVDGVKAARKISKATIMSKAREYITVLKRRETRLQGEVTAMKDLLSSLVNGPVLLQAFEAEWAIRQAAEAADDEMDSGDMDSDEGDDDESADERPRKKPKTIPAMVPVAPVKPKKEKAPRTIAAPGTPALSAEEARPKKRGRPPKNAATRASPSSVSPTQVHFTVPLSGSSPTAPQHTQTQYSFVPVVPQQQKRPAYLLASFVFLSFFKPSPRESVVLPSDEGTNHSHLGRVLSSHENPFGASIENGGIDAPWYSHPVLHVFHTTVMIALFIALVVSMSPQSARSKVWRYLSRFSSAPATVDEKLDEKESVDTMSPTDRAENELKSTSSTTKSKVKVFAALQTGIERPTSEQLGLMALLRFPSKPSQATELWKEAASTCDASAPFKPAFEIPLEAACSVLQAASTRDSRSPLVVIASKSVETRLGEMLKDAFVNDVNAICEPSTPLTRDLLMASESTKRARDDLATRAMALGGRPAELVKEWDQAFSGHVFKGSEVAPITGKSADDTGVVLLRVLTLMRRIFPAASRPSLNSPGGLPSPPPSPLPREELVKMERVLRVSLDAKVFHGAGLTQDAVADAEKERERCEEVQRARDMLISRLSQAARMRRMVALEREDEE